MMSISQSAVSKTISRVESTLNVKLFIRSQLGIVPTPDGVMLLDYINSIFEGFDLAANRIERIRNPGAMNINIGMHVGPSGYFHSQILSKLGETGALQAGCKYGSYSETVSQLSDGSIDIFLGDISELSTSDFVLFPFFKDQYCVVLSSSIPPIGTSLPESILKRTWVIPDLSDGLQQSLSVLLIENGYNTPLKRIVTSSDSLIYLLCATMGMPTLWPRKLSQLAENLPIYATEVFVPDSNILYGAAVRKRHEYSARIFDILSEIQSFDEVQSLQNSD